MERTFDTWLPCFPGFYESRLYHSDMESEATNSLICEVWEHDFPRDLIRYWFRNHHIGRRGDLKCDFEKYQKDIAESFCSHVSMYIDEATGDFSTIEFRHIWSPAEYNFRTDEVHCTITIDTGKTVNYLKNHREKFFEYIKDIYGADASFDEWFEAESWSSNDAGTVLQFILWDWFGGQSEAENAICDRVLEDVWYVDYFKFPEALESYLESDDARELGREYDRLSRQGVLYLEAMHHSKRAQELVEAGFQQLLEDCLNDMEKAIENKIA